MDFKKQIGNLISFELEGDAKSKQGVVRYVTQQREIIFEGETKKIITQQGFIVESGCGELWWVPTSSVMDD